MLNRINSVPARYELINILKSEKMTQNFADDIFT